MVSTLSTIVIWVLSAIEIARVSPLPLLMIMLPTPALIVSLNVSVKLASTATLVALSLGVNAVKVGATLSVPTLSFV